MSEYQAIVFDLDGTAIPNQRGGLPSRRVIETIAKYRNSIHLIAATGRPIDVAMPVLDALGLVTPTIVSGGAVILEARTHNILKHTSLPASAVHEIITIMQNLPYHLYLKDEQVSPRAAISQPSLQENIEIIYIASIPVTKAPALVERLRKIPDIDVSAVPDWQSVGVSINITHIGATKEHAVAEVLGSLGVAQTEAIGVGDGDNDIHLFRSVGLKVAMGNAGSALKAAADIIAPSVDDDGLAEIIERYA